MNNKIKIAFVSAEGCGVGKSESGQIVFVQGTIPGDEVLAEIPDSDDKKAVTGKLLEIITHSPNRVQHPCPYYTAGCIGSTLGVMDYKTGLNCKRNNLKEALKRIGKIDQFHLDEACESPVKWNYRDRLELQIIPAEKGFSIGYRALNKFIPVDGCMLADNIVNSALAKISAISAETNSLTFKENTRLALRNNGRNACTAVGFAFSKKDAGNLRQILTSSGIPGFQIRLMKSVNSRLLRSEFFFEWGDTSVEKEIGGTVIKIDPSVFSQTNSKMDKILREKIIAELPEKSTILDLYGGFGGWSLEYVSRKQGEAVVIESSKKAVRAGNTFAKNRMLNIEYIEADLSSFNLKALEIKQLAVIIADPPRSGLSETVLDYIDNSGCPKFIYVSCHPAVLARDIAKMKNYKPEKFIPLDMFPQTPELETIAELNRI